MSYRHNFLVYLSEGMENCKMSGKSQGILRWKISGNPDSISHSFKSLGTIGRAPDSKVRGPGFDTQSGHILSFLLLLIQEGGGGGQGCQVWRKYVHEVLVNGLGGLSLPRKSVVRLTDRPDMTLDVYRGRKTTMQQQQRQN